MSGTLLDALRTGGNDPTKQIQAAYAWFAANKRQPPTVLDHGVLTQVDDDMNVVARVAYMTALITVDGTEYAKQTVLGEAAYANEDIRILHKCLTVLEALRELIKRGILQ